MNKINFTSLRATRLFMDISREPEAFLFPPSSRRATLEKNLLGKGEVEERKGDLHSLSPYHYIFCILSD